MAVFGIVETWRETLRLTRRDFGVHATLAAAFVLLPAIALDVFGPAQPTKFSQMTGTVVLLQGVLALIGAISQLAIARLTISGGTPREALGHALIVLPRLIVVAFLTTLPLVPALLILQAAIAGVQAAALPGLILIIPGLYAAARLSLAMPALASRSIGPVAALRQSWAATSGNGWRLLGFMAMMLMLMFGLLVLASGVGNAIGSLLTLAGSKALAHFIVALLGAAVAAVYAVYSSVGLATAYKRLVG